MGTLVGFARNNEEVYNQIPLKSKLNPLQASIPKKRVVARATL